MCLPFPASSPPPLDSEPWAENSPGISATHTSLTAQTLTTTGTAAPSAVRAAIAATGRDAILRGAGAASSPSAVAILENFEEARRDNDAAPAVHGLVRMVQVAPRATAVDVGVDGAARGRWTVSVRSSGDVRGGCGTVGAVWGREESEAGAKGADAKSGAKGSGGEDEEELARGWIAEVEVGADGSGETVAVAPFGVNEVLGRALLVERTVDGVAETKTEQDGRRADAEPVMGVIARSAGAWENDKTVCSCSGKTVWEERGEQKERGMP